MKELTAVVIGATGLTGSLVMEELLNDASFGTVRVLARRAVKRVHPKLQQEWVNFNDPEDYSRKLGDGDVIFCCIGTTQKKVRGDKEAYRKVDHDIPLNAARFGINRNFSSFLIVSAIGANKNSSNFYLRLKGQTESDLRELPYKRISIFQPSIIRGKREENRTIEKILQMVSELTSFMFLGPLKKYRAIGADNIAKAMVCDSKKSDPGVHSYQYPEMMSLARGEY